MRPVEGVKSGGCKGLAKGTYQGVSGLVIKPVAGVLDATSKTAEGIKNTATYWDKKINEERGRIPRPFYGKEKFYKAYREIDAEILKALRIQGGDEFKDIELVGSVDVNHGDKNKPIMHILAVTYGPIVYWNTKKNKIVWSFYPGQLETLELKSNETELVFYPQSSPDDKKV